MNTTSGAQTVMVTNSRTTTAPIAGVTTLTGNQSDNPTTVALPDTGTTQTDLAAGKPTSESSNTVTLTFPAATEHYFHALITADSGRPAGQVSEFHIWSS